MELCNDGFLKLGFFELFSMLVSKTSRLGLSVSVVPSTSSRRNGRAICYLLLIVSLLLALDCGVDVSRFRPVPR